MKKVKILVGLFVLSCFLPLANVNAVDGILGIFGVTIPKSSSDWYYSGTQKKSQVSYQYYNSGGAIDTIGTEIAIHGRTWDGENNSGWLTFPKNQYVTWGEGNLSNLNFDTGTYGLDISRIKSGIFNVTHSGNWYLNKNKLPASSGIK